MSEASFPEIAPLPAVMGMKEVCELIGITAETGRRLINDGALPGHRVPGGRQWVFRTEEVLTAISTWAVDGDVAPAMTAGAATRTGQPATDVAVPINCPDPVEVTCLAPPRVEGQTETEWRESYTRTWLIAAESKGIPATSDGAGFVTVGNDELALSVEACAFPVVDDEGDETVEAAAMVCASLCSRAAAPAPATCDRSCK